MSSKKVTLKKKIDDKVFDIYPKTSAQQVSYGESTVEETLDDIESALEGIEYSAVTASETNGNIKINGVETTVYTEPASIEATKITQDTTHKFVTESQITEFNAKSSIEVVSELPQTVSDNSLYLVLDDDE